MEEKQKKMMGGPKSGLAAKKQKTINGIRIKFEGLQIECPPTKSSMENPGSFECSFLTITNKPVPSGSFLKSFAA